MLVNKHCETNFNLINTYLKPPKHSLDNKMGKHFKYQKYLNNFVIKHKLRVRTLCTNQDIFQYTIQ